MFTRNLVKRGALFCVLGLALASACSQELLEVKAKPLGERTQALASLPLASVPLPLNASTQKVSWNGTFPELLAADALAECTLKERVGVIEGATSDTDTMLRNLALNISSALCVTAPVSAPAGYTSTEAFYWRWLEGRKIAGCNRDPLTQQLKAMEFNFSASVGTNSSYGLPDYNTYITGTPAFGGAETAQARNKAQDQIHYAWLNLCMAQKLKDHLESVQVALASESDLLQLQQFARERAMKALFQYTTIVKNLDYNAPTIAMLNPWQFPNIIMYWALKDSNWSSKAQRLGQDLAIALRLVTDLSRDNTTSILRNASAQRSFGSLKSRRQLILGGLDSALAGPRVDALLTAYGQHGSTLVRGIVTDVSAPEVETLYSLLRSANALRITGASKAFDIKANALNMLTAAEQYVRQRDCLSKGDGTTPCWQIPGGLPPAQYLIRQRFNIQPEHGQALVQAYLEHLYGRPSQDTSIANGVWTYRFDTQDVLAGLPLDIKERMPGSHVYSGDFSAAGGGTLTLDATNGELIGTTTQNAQAQAWAYVPSPVMNYAVHPYDVGYGLRSEAWGYYSFDESKIGSPIGSQSVLGYARMALSRAPVFAAPILQAAGAPLWALIERTVGSRQVVMRRALVSVASTNCGSYGFTASGTGTYTVPANCTVGAESLSSGYVLVEAWGNSRAGDLYDRIYYREITSPLQSGAPGSFSAGANDGLNSNVLSFSGDITKRYGLWILDNTVSDMQLGTSGAERLPLLRGKLDQPLGYDSTLPYGLLPINAFQRPSLFARVLTYGGALNAQLARAWQIQPNRWNVPKFDGLNLPTEWAPLGDASLQGGQPGQEIYQHLLEVADEAANEATKALDRAVEQLGLESQDALQLEQAETKSMQLLALEEQTVCGAAANVTGAAAGSISCVQTPSSASLTIPACPAGPGICATLATVIPWLIGTNSGGSTLTLTLASEVAVQVGQNGVPDFSKYNGGELEGALLNQWSAWKKLERLLVSALGAATAADGELSVALAERTASDSELSALKANTLVQLANALTGVAEAQADINKLNSDTTTFLTQRGTAELEASNVPGTTGQCSQWAFDTSIKAGRSYVGQKNVSYNMETDTLAWTWKENQSNRSWSQGPFYDQVNKCIGARQRFADLMKQQEPLMTAINSGIVAAQDRIATYALTAFIALPKQLEAAITRAQVAPARVHAEQMQGFSVISAQILLLQQAINDVLTSNTVISQLTQRAAVAKAQIDLDRQLASVDVKGRFNLRRSLRSYELWRARALSENARRLAVSARRAIESRFVVDMSTLQSQETYVEAPALWADEVYSADLKPPSSLGLTSMLQNEGAASYTNKLVDYVRNLRLFVTGYPVSRPTASVRQDAEVMQLAGPSNTKRVPARDGTVYDFRDPESSGWSFYCDDTAKWVQNPQAATFDPTTWNLRTMCGGKPPSRARLGFGLDPWGRVRTSAPAAVNARHNVRWQSLAVNLVGSGIRYCPDATDSSACYAEPFIRYQLNHVGPAQISDYTQTWTTMNLPTGIVEGGKALASEEWLDPVSNGFNTPMVANITRREFAGRPMGGAYELILELPRDVRVENIERIQILAQSDYWVRQQ
jgi:hypothetical protein